jgi:hypothetical protein
MLNDIQNTALVSAIKAVSTLDNAVTAVAKRVDAMIAAGFTAAMLATGSEHIDAIRETTARAMLTAKEYTLWADESKASKVTDKATKKRVNTERGTLVNRVDRRIALLAEKLGKVESQPETVEGDAKGAAKGAKANAPRDLKTRIMVEVGTLAKAVDRDATAETPTLTAAQRVELKAAFARIFDLTK